MRLKLFVILLVMMLILPYNSMAQDPVETRYMTTTATTVNGLSANAFSALQSTSYKQCWTGIVQTSASWGIRVWKRSSAGVETEITAGTPVAQVTRYTSSPGQGLQSATWTLPSTSLSSTDSIVVRVYRRVDGGSWYLCSNPTGGNGVFTTEQLGAASLDTSTWTVYYYTRVGSAGTGSATFYFGSSTYNSRIEGFSYSTPTTTTTTTTTQVTTTTVPTTTTTTTIPPIAVLTPGNATFSTSAIYFIVAPNATGPIFLTGNTTYLNIYWEAYYWDGHQGNINASCFLNSETQSCNVLMPAGKGVCSMLNPNYNLPYSTSNFVNCTFYNAEDKTQNRSFKSSFYPINFSVWFSDYSSIVGEEFNFPVNIENSGLFADTYRVESSTNRADIVRIGTQNFSIQLHGDSFEPHIWQQLGPEIKQINIKVTLLDASATGTNLCVNVTSSLEPTAWEPKNPCRQLKSQFKSLPELSLASLVFVMLAATIFIFKYKKRF